MSIDPHHDWPADDQPHSTGWQPSAQPQYGPPAAPVPSGYTPTPAGPAPAPVGGAPRRRRSRLPLILGTTAAVCVILLGAGIIAYAFNLGPLQDSGIAACQSMRNQANSNKATGTNQAWTQAQYQATRKQFADSRYGDIRDAGTHMVDLIWQFSQAGSTGNSDDAAGLALMMGGRIMDTWASLTGACANHGVTLPALGSGTSGN